MRHGSRRRKGARATAEGRVSVFFRNERRRRRLKNHLIQIKTQAIRYSFIFRHDKRRRLNSSCHVTPFSLPYEGVGAFCRHSEKRLT